MDKAGYAERLRLAFSKYDFGESDFKKIIFWGMGATAQAWWDDMMEAGLTPQYIVDVKKAHTEVKGYSLIAPEEITDAGDYMIVVMSTNPYVYQDIAAQISAMKLEPKLVCPCSAVYYWIYRERLINMLYALEDEASLNSLTALIEARVNGELLEENVINRKQYFPFYCFSRWNEKEVYVDAGAFVGDTLEQFLFEKFGTFEAYYAFEPLRKNYRALKYRVERLEKEWGAENKIICVNSGLDKAAGEQKMSCAFPVGAMIENTADKREMETISVTSIDAYFADKRITTIKADIEGKETDMLMGAENSIKKWKPNMAISIYHKPSDLFKIFELIASYKMDYKFSLRCHAASGGDTVLYTY